MIGGKYEDFGWAAVQNGATLWHSDYWGDTVEIKLPDDMLIAGEQIITITAVVNGITYSGIVDLSLVYNGNYQIGNGWSIYNVSY